MVATGATDINSKYVLKRTPPSRGGGSASRRPGARRKLTALALVLAVATAVGLTAAGAAPMTFTVNSTADRVDSNPGDGLCRTSAGTCTVRAAVQESNALTGADTIVVPAGVYSLQLPTVNEDLDTTGDFDIHSPMTIVGAGAATTIVDAGFPLPGADPTARGLDRLFEIHPSSGNVLLRDVTIREGFSTEDGGAIQNWSPGLLRLENVHVLDSYAGGAGGGLNNANPADYEWVVEPLVPPKSGRVEIVNSTFSGNAAGESGAAVNNTAMGTVSILAGSRIVDNPGEMIPDPAQVIDPLDPEPIEYIPGPGVYQPSAGAIANQGADDTVGTIRITDSTISGNFAAGNGAGVLNDGSGALVVESTTITGNETEAGGGGLYTTGGSVTVTGSTISGNVAADGGGIYSNGSVDSIGLRPRFSLTSSTVSGNTAHASGGGMLNDGEAQLAITDVTFSGNRAHDAGGGLNIGGQTGATLTRLTVTGNETNNEGGGAWIGAGRLVTVADSTFTGNDAGVPTPGDLADPAGANIAGGGGLYTEGGPLTITGSTFADNTATEEGGGVSIDNLGDVTISDSVIRDNRAGADGGGVENSGARVTFERLLITGNRSTLDGGGIYSSASGLFTILDTTVQLNSGASGGGLANAPDNDLIVRNSLFLRNIARPPVMSGDGDLEGMGYGGGIFSLADGDSLIENTTLSSNTAAVGGGGIFHDADGELRLIHMTIWRNSAPRGGGVGVAESDFVPDIPPKANVAVIAKNSIIGGSRQGGSCDWYISSEGGNLDGLGTQSAGPVVGEGALLPANTYCFLYAAPNSDVGAPAARDRRSATFALDAIADNGGPTQTHALHHGSLAIDAGVSPCPETDQRGVTRPQNGKCDTGAYEFVGPPPPFDDTPPETALGNPLMEQDGLETMLLHFSGSDNLTPIEELQFECRLFETDLTEPPEPQAPWEPIPPELWWVGCSNPWQVPLLEPELGLYTFEVRAVDRAGKVDPTPAVHIFNADDTPPDTLIAEKPPLVTNSRSATFTFSGTDNLTPPQFMEFECRLDSRDPEMWLECTNPTFFSNLTSGSHTLEVRAYDGAELVDPTPARYTWTVAQGPSCNLANITLTPVADGWVDEVNPFENYLFETELTVASGATGGPTAVPPEPLVGQNARALYRFALPADASGCELESATLRLYNESPTEGRALEAVPLAGLWAESTLTWFNQPGTVGGAVSTAARHGYQEWNVTSHVTAMTESGANYGWQIRDAVENDPEGGDQSFLSREMPQDPPDMTLPQLVLRYVADASPPPPPPTPATAPTTVHCGQVLTESTLLANDLIGCLGEGLVIGAPDIVVDLNGHTITSGALIEPGEEEGLLPGIRNGGRANVVIRNGTISGFGYGVLLGPGTTHNVVEDLILTGNVLAGAYLLDADDGRNGNTIRNNHFDHNGETGLSIMSESENSVVEGNTFIGNGMSIYLFASSGHRIEGNQISGIVLNPLLDSDAGIVLEEGSSNNVMIDNDISDTGDAGVIIHMGSHGNRVEGGEMTRNGDAGVIITDSDRNQVIGIVAHMQSDGGVVLGNAHDTVVRDNDLRFNPNGVEASGTNNLVLENNNANRSLGDGFALGDGANMVVVGNVANLTGGAGIALEGGAFDAAGNAVGGALIEGNTTNENASDGISVADGGHTIRNNTAHNNAGFGIVAGEVLDPGELPGPGASIDGGGNVAAGNAEPEQCRGVVCAPGTAPPPSAPDTTAPETTILSTPTNPTGSSSATFTFTADDGPGGVPLTALVFECRLDPAPDPAPEPPDPPEPPEPGQPPDIPEPVEGEGWAECVSPVHYNGLDQGMHHFEVRAMDQSDNFDLTPATHDWEVDILLEEEGTGPDSVPPDTRIASAPSSPTTSTTATFHFAGTDNSTPGANLTFECSLNGAPFTTCLSPITYSGLGAGSNTFAVRASDRAPTPNTDPTPATHTWEIVLPPPDTTAPDTTILSGPDPITTLTSATFTFSTDETGATFECSLDGAPFTACASPSTLTGLPVGARELQVRARDAAGNVDASPAVYAWTVSAAPVPTTVFCGQVLTQSTLVRNDLHDCLWDGLVIGANGITIDLGGHTIDGTGIAAGIRNDGFDSVSIKNGTVVEFDYGVMLNPGTERNIVEGMTLQSDQEAGIALGLLPHPLAPTLPFPEPPPPTFQAGVRDNTLRGNTLLANDLGIWLTNATRGTLIRDNEISVSSKGAVLLERSSQNRIESNDVVASSDAAVKLVGSSNNVIVDNALTESDGGVFLGVTDSAAGHLPSDDNLVERNIITESGGPALELAGSSNSTVRGNRLLDNVASTSNGEGLLLHYASDTLARGNDLRNNTAGIALKSSSENRLEANDTSSSDGTGISVSDLSLSNEIVGNTSSNNTGAGIYVGDETAADSGTLIEGNRTHNNTSYGIHVSKVSHIVRGNLANENGTWGIYASEGSNGRFNVDGGGNRAQGNLGPIDPFTLQPLQCFTILCTGGDVPADQIPPDTLLLEAPPDPSTSGSATFNFTGSDNQGSVTFECRVDGGAYAPCTSPHTVNVGAGAHAFEVRAVDISGNVDPTPASHSWTVNPSPGAPNTTIDSGPDATTVSTTATFAFSASEGGATLQCALDGGAFTACSSPTTVTGLGVGTHTFQVRATDSGGDTDPTPATLTWTIGSAPVPATVGCGEIVVQSIRLQNDLFDCGGHGLIVGANGITIDLDGHTIDGVGLDAGILNNGFDSVTITNGTVTQFDYGLQLNPGTSRNVVSALRVEANQEAGILLSDADQNGQGNTIRANTVLANGVGIWVGGNTRHSVIRNNTLGGNAGDGVYLEFASDNLLEGNEIARSGGHGIAIVGGGSNTIVGNTLATNGGYGIAAGEALLPSNDNRIERNTVTEGQGGILVVDSDRTQVIYNIVRGSSGPGVALELAADTLVRGNDVRSNASGIELSEASGNRIEANNASGTLGTGISIEALSYSNVVVQNTASQNGGEGIAVEDFALVGMGNLLDRNTADGNGGDGIGVFGAGHTVTGNGAKLNGGWGIYVAVGGAASDGGGNTAAGNAEPAQCFGVVCTIGTVPGSPETWIVEGPVDADPGTPGIQSNSRNASFTYRGSDDPSPITDIVFECRLDSTNDLAWEDCEYPAEYLNLSAGPHVFEVRAIDSLGAGLADPTPARFEWTYVPLPSGVAPQAILDITPPLESQMFEALFTFHSNEPDVTFECRVDNLGYEPCGFEGATYMSQGAYVAEFEETQVGSHTFSVRAIDFEGNIGAPATYTWSIMGIVTTFTAGPGFTPSQDPAEPPTGGPVAESSATLDFIANVADATYECSLDLAPFTPCTPPVTYTNLTPGDHMLRVVATDLATGASEMEAAVYEWEIVEIVDVTPPNTSIERAPAPNTSSTIFEFTGTDDLTLPAQLTFQCRVDSTNELDWFECTSPFNLLDLYTYADPQMAPGEHTFEVRAIDMAEPPNPDPNFEGNVDPTPDTHTWTMVADTVAPGTGILSGPLATVGAGAEVLIEFFGTDNATPELALAFECAVDAAPFAACESPASLQGLAPGEHTFRVRAVDLAGNADATPATRTFTVMAAPVTTITSGPAGQVVDGVPPAVPSTTENAVFVFSSNQVGSTFECALDGGDFAPCTSPWAFWVTESGTHELEVRATNPEGVIEEPAAAYEWVVQLGPDSTPPNTTITSGPSNPSTSEVATFSFVGSDNRTPSEALTFECSLDGAGFNSCVSPQEFSDLTHSSHTLLVRAVDAEGNFDPTPASRTWVVELPPVVTILSGPAEQSDSADATFTFESNVAGSTFTCWLDGLMEPCTSPKSYAGLATGEHLFAVLATAPGGTTGLQWEEYEWEIGDFTAPVTTISSGPDAQTESTSATFVFSSEPGVTFMCSLDGSEPLPCTSPHELPFLWPGAHTFEVYAITSTLLVEPVVATYEWTIIDLEAPTTAVEYGPPATATSPNAFFGFSSDDPTAIFECSLDGTAFAECDPQSVFEGLPAGPHTLLVRAVDVAGNVDATPASYEWTIVAGALNTPVGTNVVVELPLPGSGPATLTFLEVAVAGSTTLDVLTGGPSLPPGYSLAGGSFYDVNTTAEGDLASLCFPYEPASFPDTAVRLLQLDGATWIDVTTLNDPTGRVCGLPEELGVFVVASASGIAPLASIISGPPAVSLSGSATFTFWSDTPGSLLLCSIDGLPFAPCTSPVTYTHLEEGGQEFQVMAVGPDGQMQLIPTLYEWEVVLPPDTTGPETTITRGAPLLTVNYISSFEFAGSDDQTHSLELEFECSLDGAAFEQCETPEEIEVTTAGEHTLLVRAVDIAGNADPTPAVWEWTVVDMSAPDTSIDSGPADETTETSATFEFTGEEPDGTPVTQFECSLDNAEFAPCTSPHTVTGLFAGPHVFQARAVDPAGTVDPTPDFYEWLIAGTDVTPPDTFILSGPPPGNSGPDVLFGFTASEPAEFECSLDGAPFEGCEAVHELLGLTQGEHTLRVRAIDLAEPPNVDATPASYTWTTLGEPNTAITSGPPDPSGSYSATFTFTSDQPGATFQCAVDGTPWVPCTSPFLAGPLLEDTHELEVRAVNQFTFADGSQVVDQTPATYEWTIEDITPPETTVTAMTFLPPTDLSEPNSFKFEFTGEDNRTASFELDFECSLDGGPFEGCESPHFIPLEELGGGEHELEVRAIDELGNIDPTPASRVWDVEGEPETTILTGPAVQVESADATFTFSSDQAGATFECSLDLAPFSACSSPVTFTGVPYGEHELQARAVSPEGTRVDLTPAVHAWESGDMTPPVVTMASGPAASTTDTTATFTFSADDPDALFLCSLDGALPAFCTSPLEYTGLLGGDHVLEIEATKPNLLVEGVAAVWEWTVVDETAPETTIVASPPALVALDAPAAFTFSSNEPDASFECSLDAGPFEPCAGPPANSAAFEEAAGEHTLLVRAVDPSLNADASPESASWTVIAPPDTAITGPASPSVTASATFTFVDQPTSTYECSLDGAAFAACTSPVEVTDLPNGEHAFRVRATTALGVVESPAAEHAWTVAVPDTSAPETTIDSGPPASTPSTTALFTFSAGELDAVLECSLDGAAFAGCSSPLELTAVPVGPHTLQVRAVDQAGNADQTPASYPWTVTAPPADNTPVGTDVSVTVEAGDGTSATLTFSAVTAAGATSIVALGQPPALPAGYLTAGAAYYDLSTSAAYTAPIEVCIEYAPASVPEPARLLHFEGGVWEDVTTSADPGAGVICGVVDSLSPFAIATGTAAVVPDTSIEIGPPASTVSTTAEFLFSSNDPLATFECSLDDPSDWGSCTPTTSFTGLAVGEHELLVRAKNAAGLFDATPARRDWTVLAPPETTILSGPEATTESTSATFTFTSDQPGATFECLLDDAPAFTACASGITYTGLALDEHEFLVRAVDSAGNADPTPAEHSWEIGDIPPAVTIESGPAATTESAGATFTFSAPESGLAFECALDGGAWSSCTSPRSYNGLALGSHTFQVRVFSPAAVVPAPIASHTWTVVDLSAPETTISSGPSATTTSTTASFVFSSSESGSAFECSLDGAAYAACTVPASYSGLSLGGHTFSVRATDPSGNADATPATHAWTVASSCSSVTTQTVGANADSWIDQASPSQNSGTDSTLKVRSKSGSQNARALVRFNLPAIPAGCVVQAATLRLFSDSAVSGRTLQALRVTGTWTEGGVTWANQPATNGTSATTGSGTGWRQWNVLAHVQTMYSGTNNGFLVRDATENAGASPEQSLHSREKGTDMPQLVLTFGPPDTSPPQTTIDSGPAATTTSTSASFAISSSESGSTFQCSLDGAAFTACTSPAAYTGLGLGAHTFAVRATDAAGNVDPTPASHAWTVEAPPPDSTPPDTTLSGQPANPTASTSASFTLSSSESGSTFQCSLDGAAFTACTSPAAYTGLALGAHTFAARAIDVAGNVDPTPAAHAWTISASCSTLTLTATADSWIDQASSSQNKGTDASLKVRSKNGSQNVRSLVRFDLPAIPGGCVVQSATLRLFSDSAVNGRTLQALRVNASWTENGVTWANQPSTTGSAATTSSGTGWRQWSVLSQLQAMYSGTNNGFLIRDATEGAGAGPEQSFHSREKGSEAPQLVITLVAG